ncbi:MAG: Mur ligase family protein, partial [Kiritimatiellaeota bacterium]|nr:Mur ligase family protein [Kiritimatiellota bacterium]
MMDNAVWFTSREAARWVNGRWRGAAPKGRFCGVVTDSRAEGAGKFFVALKGAQYDGHAFVEQAVANGAMAVLVRQDWQGEAPFVLEVANSNRGLMNLARGYRKTVGPQVVGITGSVGKTTVKEMAAVTVGTLGETAKTPGNFNNEVGLPLSILSMPRTCRYGVFEAGI